MLVALNYRSGCLFNAIQHRKERLWVSPAGAGTEILRRMGGGDLFGNRHADKVI